MLRIPWHNGTLASSRYNEVILRTGVWPEYREPQIQPRLDMPTVLGVHASVPYVIYVLFKL